MEQEILNAHNKYRKQVGLPPLRWSNQLEADAKQWAAQLTKNQTFQHAKNRNEQGENLWMGTSHHYSFTQMVDKWGDERKHFKHGTFPNVSSTGKWSDVGHYTQIVWKDTSHVGCAGFDGPDGKYRLVCRYKAPGNVNGQKPF
jgi:hypothetical protein